MGYILTNLVPILIATVIGLIVSVVYRSMSHRIGELDHGVGAGGLLIVAVLAEFWLACILAGALILAPQQADPWVMAIGSAVVIWIGFVVPVLAVTEIFRAVSVQRTLSDCLLWLVVMVVQATALHAIGLTHPQG